MNLRKEYFSSLIFLFFAVAIIIASVKARLGSFANPGPGILPFLAALLLGCCSLVNLVLNAIGKSIDKGRPIFSVSEINWKNIIASVTALLAFPGLINVFGFNLTVFGFMLFMLKFIGAWGWTKSVLSASITTVACHFLFVYWLKFVAEKGIFGI